MKFESVIIGGGLAGLTAGISLAKRGFKVAIISTGHSALFFNGGSLGLLKSGLDFDSLPVGHPYKKIGRDNIPSLAEAATDFLKDSGLEFLANRTRITPMGLTTEAWLTLDGMLTVESLEQCGAKKIAITGIDGFLDFYPRFIASALEKRGYECKVTSISSDSLRRLRTNESEMRAANISRIISTEGLSSIAEAINRAAQDCDTVIFPAVVGSESANDFNQLRKLCGKQLFYAPTVGVSVPGIMIANALTKRFKSLGGTILKGQTVTAGTFDGNRLISINTDKFDEAIKADRFILAAGSFFSHGLKALPTKIIEPALNLDTLAPAERGELYNKDVFSPQPYMQSGVITNNSFNTAKDGKTIENLHAVGSILSSADSLTEDSGAGIAMLTALHVANSIK